jgi:hypothetical protein
VIEFLLVGEEAQDAPLIIVRNLNPLGASQIAEAIRPLSLGTASTVELSELSAFASENVGTFAAIAAARDYGLWPIVGTENDFECALKRSTWEEVIGLLEPFTTEPEGNAPHAHAYLSRPVRLVGWFRQIRFGSASRVPDFPTYRCPFLETLRCCVAPRSSFLTATVLKQ